jgi:hypothetical protein
MVLFLLRSVVKYLPLQEQPEMRVCSDKGLSEVILYYTHYIYFFIFHGYYSHIIIIIFHIFIFIL